MQSFIRAVKHAVFAAALLPAMAFADAKEEGPAVVWPDQLIETVTTELLEAVEVHKPTFSEDPEPFYNTVKSTVLPVMDMRNFSRGVMGRYGSTKAYRVLKTKEEKQAFKDRILAFSEVFESSVVRTYSKGLMTFNGETINVIPMTDEQRAAAGESGRATIVQHIVREGEEPYVLEYSFGRSKSGQWLARNILVDGINLGRVYQSQFSQAVKDNGNSVDAAIKNWAVTLEDEVAPVAE